MDIIVRNLNKIKELGLYPDVKVIENSPNPEVIIHGRKILLFCSSNYLGMATNQELINTTIEAFKKYGTGSGGSRLLSGTYDSHIELDATTAKFKGTEDAITFNSGFQTNSGVIEALTKTFKFDIQGVLFPPKTIIFSDSLNHASIVDGCRNSRTKVFVYPHSNMDYLERGLKKYKKKRKIIITDGIFSMDGDVAKLDKIVSLSEEYGGMVYVDDAHATGVLGKHGGGTAEHFNLQKKVHIQMGTFSKAVGVLGGYIASNKSLVEYLRITTRSYIFSTAMPPAIACSITKSLKMIHENFELRERLFLNANYLRNGLKKMGFNTLNSETQIIPILIGDDINAIKFSELLFEKGILGPNVRWPAVEKGKARIRLTVMATHTKEQINFLLKACEVIGKELKLL